MSFDPYERVTTNERTVCTNCRYCVVPLRILPKWLGGLGGTTPWCFVADVLAGHETPKYSWHTKSCAHMRTVGACGIDAKLFEAKD